MFESSKPIALMRKINGRKRTCMACGDLLPPRHRRYCSNACRQQLFYSLNRRTGLLRALNTRYATFYFTDGIIVMDLLPYDLEQIYSYILPRGSGRKPVDDFCSLSNMLGAQWWHERNRTKKRYLASQHVLAQALKTDKPKETIIPVTLSVPSVRSGSLITLELNAADLTLANMHARIKQAYRCQVKKHHPDIGGTAQAFVKIQEAYEKLIDWSRNPTYVRRGGFTDKWLYEGTNNRWIQPAPQNRI
jgi:predicted nucleic acid-binding Zn ribbon protein